MAIPYRTQRLLKRLGTGILVTVLIVAVASLCWLLWLERFIVYDREEGLILDDRSSIDIQGQPLKHRNNLPKVEIYYNEGENAIVTETDMEKLTGYYISAADLEKDITAIRPQLEALEPGTPVMIDVKNIKGELFYDSAASEYRSSTISASAMSELLKYLNSNGFYTIARMPAFRDFNFGLNNVAYGLPTSGGYLWVDSSYCYWLNPSSQVTRSYLISIISELKNMGFDEVVLTDFVFPESTEIVFDGDRQGAINDCAKVLVDTCSSEAFTVSFVGTANFTMPTGRSRLYLENAQPAQAATLAQATGLEQPEIYVVFITELHDTRFDDYGVLRPLSGAH
jgi:hypothetical protein